MKNIFILIMTALNLSSCFNKYESKQYIDSSIEYTNNINIDAKSRNFDAIDFIKQSYFTTYTNIKIEDLISAFNFVEWRDFISEDDYMRYVDIIGTIDDNQYIFQFKILNIYRWELFAFEINDKAYTTDKASNILYALYTNKNN